jgi:prepilin-type N-terminal cleavage/methylation domain-containing protein/prepilin-type processing-associated H-X9-DG protein
MHTMSGNESRTNADADGKSGGTGINSGIVVRTGGFTLIELLVVLAIIAIVAALLLPALSRAKQKAQGISCTSQISRLTLGWMMYNGDNNGFLAPNCENLEQPNTWPDPLCQPGGQYAQWCPGNLKIADLIAYQANFIRDGLIYPYVKAIEAYKCAADASTVKFGPKEFPRSRSYSMNCWLSPFPGKDWATLYPSTQARIFNKESDMVQPGPTMTFVFIDENANSIDDGYFAGSPGLPGKWCNVPSTRHGNAAALSYADGHAEIKRWTDAVVLHQNVPGFKITGGPTFPCDSSSGDNTWLEQRESVALQ